MKKKVIEDNPKKERKVTSGPIRDKERTKARMIAAVGKVIQKKGYHALNGPNIALECGLNKALIWNYFGGLDQLVEAYLTQKDFWQIGDKGVLEQMITNPGSISISLIEELLKSQFNTFLKDKTKQKVIHWGLGEKTKALKNIADRRELLGEELFKHVDSKFENSENDLRATLAILVSSIYYLSLQAKSTGSTFCGIDVNTEAGKERIQKTMRKILEQTFSDVEL
ncbi:MULTISPECIES: TetR/AcrR family transcriptional regulator [Sphingobacterium]|jgi:AcrR family transcriptional regulator|uniref:TetR family transcriptional regulator n=3 Tax=Sphingobacterium TaxID=28453 RepID=A0A654D0R1_SPHMU|nr:MULTISPECIES: TetR/AcrR family transcriptional regulator [Sphingobacterium]HAE66274.1 TetR/AcrR family transcriptional regulator [Sphingobacterium sp.]OFV10255.1 TetR family transcriptional regulator [Sphingobacterium sp. HMSC13C05]QQT32272.1 TetR/AcrR family transcriptional regulator [Sphingobacterium multivorum]QQT44969.1 TetR/AcrR family transcriptional regulator [Sphingobacterium multivorum]QQT51810.1 TetR/AcrR family transcriptional regulator [Sphingobacterium multivorum]